MTAAIKDGQKTWSMSVDDDGTRNYELTWLVITTDPLDGPYVISQTPGLFLPGSNWSVDNDYDPWAFCSRRMTLQPIVSNEPNYYWNVTQFFSTAPDFNCQDDNVEDPLLKPDVISGSFLRRSLLQDYDRNGVPLVSSSWEPLNDELREFDDGNMGVVIQQNVSLLELPTISNMVNTVNDATLWGMAARYVKLSNLSWTKNYYGSCYIYFTRTLEFEVSRIGFDRTAVDRGTKVLNGYWDDPAGTGTGTGLEDLWVTSPIDGIDPNPNNPQHFIQAKDRNGENIELLLNGAGLPLSEGSSPVSKTIEYYPESNFLSLGIPTDLEG